MLDREVPRIRGAGGKWRAPFWEVADMGEGISSCEHCIVRHRGVCEALSEDELLQLNKLVRLRKFPAGQILMSDSEPADFLANIVSGVVKLTKTLPDGRQQIVGLQFAPDFLGRAYGESNTSFAEAAGDVELCCFPREPFERMMDEHPGLEHRLFEHTLDELDSAREWMLLLGRMSAREKVASFLMMIAKRCASIGCAHTVAPGHAQFALPLTRSDIADFLGLTIETVSRQITKLKVSGVIQILSNREIVVPDIDVLARIAGQSSYAVN